MVVLPIFQREAGPLKGPVLRRCFGSTSRRQTTYGFVGLGRMGYPMAKNLRSKLSSSDRLIIYDTNQDATTRFSNEMQGTVVADGVRDLAENSETIITVLPEPSHVQNVFQSMLKPPSLLKEGINKERLFIDCSTIDPRSSHDVANAVHSTEQGRFVDAPMSGGVVGAEAGKLTFMLGAHKDLVGRVNEILMLMGKRVVYLGPQTCGLKGKLANNYLLALNNIATAEAMQMGVKWGLDPTVLADMINASTGRCWPSEVNNPVPGVSISAPASNGYVGGFGVKLMNKDLRLATQAAKEAGIETRLGPHARKVYDEIEAIEDLENKDFSVVYKYFDSQ
ncbi:hypothetical protein AAFC00_001382 [Neodothiora populina]